MVSIQGLNFSRFCVGDAFYVGENSNKNINGQKFTTYDKIHDTKDPAELSCALKFLGGWWYNSGCTDAALTSDLPTVRWGREAIQVRDTNCHVE